jgi:glutamate N-acetyltransferase/amino-acid N-acetyltransferase
LESIPYGSTTTPLGFTAAATACGQRESGALDLALLFSDHDCSCAGVFTRNRVVAAHIILDQETINANPARTRGVVVNAGIANACTGSAGLDAARAIQSKTADAFGCDGDQVLVLSTGVIGVQLDLDKIEKGIHQAALKLSPEHGPSAARAIMTTDTRPKHTAVRVHLPGGEVTIGAMAKGSGMIHPDMATMLAVITTDAVIKPDMLEELLRDAVDHSFNRISIDGDTSTNDTVLLLANGTSGVAVDDEATRTAFTEGLDRICIDLAQAIVRDGEGASKFVTLQVTGARVESDALKVARVIATSPLVKTALAGGDPNWGRVLAASGRAGVHLDPNRLALWIGRGEDVEMQLVQDGTPLTYSEAKAIGVFTSPELTVQLDLGLGTASTTIWTCDLTHDYVTINAEYRT